MRVTGKPLVCKSTKREAKKYDLPEPDVPMTCQWVLTAFLGMRKGCGKKREPYVPRVSVSGRCQGRRVIYAMSSFPKKAGKGRVCVMRASSSIATIMTDGD